MSEEKKKEADPIKEILYNNLEMLWGKLEQQNNKLEEIKINSELKEGHRPFGKSKN